MKASVSEPSFQNTLNMPRDLSLDFLKGFSIILVVFFHNLQLNPDSFVDNIFVLLGNAAVPCFFLVSGALFFTRPFDWRKHMRHIFRFYLAMAGWRVLYLGLYRFWGVPFPVSRRELLSYLFLFGEVNGILSGHLWFIAAMLTVLLIAPVLRVCMEQDRRLVIYVTAVLFVFNQLLTDINLLSATLARLIGKGAWDMSAFGEINPFSFRYSVYIFYYLLGAFLQEEKTKKTFPVRTSALMIAAGLAGLSLIKYLQAGTLRWQGVHLSSGYYWTSTILIASGMFLLAARLPFDDSRLLRGFSKIVGGSTLGIFYLHMLFIYALTPSLFRSLASFNGWLLNLLESLLIVAGSCVIVWIGRRLPVIRYLF